MKQLLFLSLLILILGCTQQPESGNDTCLNICTSEFYELCPGFVWNITGEPPNCTCSYSCPEWNYTEDEVEDVDEEAVEVEDVDEEQTTTNSPPRDPLVVLYILNDERCSFCDASWVPTRVSRDFDNLEINYVDISTDEGRDYVYLLELTSVPAIFFDSSIEDSENFTSYVDSEWIKEVRNHWVINTPGVKEILITTSKTAVLDLFIMSHCQYGTQAVLNMEEVIDSFGEELDFEIHFMGDVISGINWDHLSEELRTMYETENRCVEKSNDKRYCSLHGEQELIGDMAILCAQEYYDNWFDFTLAYMSNGHDWEAAAEANGFDMGVMNYCVNGQEGLTLFEMDTAIAKEKSIAGSPTYLYDNTLVRMGDVTETLCGLHPDLGACS